MTNAQSAIEEWRDITGTDGMYQISNSGKVRSRVKGDWHIMSMQPNSQGYNRVQLSYPKKRKAFVHRLVAEAFIPNPENLPIVNHKDFDILNCRVDNLEWTTLQGNYDYSAERGRFVRTEIVLSSLNQCREYGFHPSCVSNCCKGKRRQTGGYTWRYADEKNLKQTR